MYILKKNIKLERVIRKDLIVIDFIEFKRKLYLFFIRPCQ